MTFSFAEPSSGKSAADTGSSAGEQAQLQALYRQAEADGGEVTVYMGGDMPGQWDFIAQAFSAQFPGVKPEIQYLRDYPFKALGAQLFGTLREISPDELKLKRYRGVQQGERIGKDGVEET